MTRIINLIKRSEHLLKLWNAVASANTCRTSIKVKNGHFCFDWHHNAWALNDLSSVKNSFQNLMDLRLYRIAQLSRDAKIVNICKTLSAIRYYYMLINLNLWNWSLTIKKHYFYKISQTGAQLWSSWIIRNALIYSRQGDLNTMD